ncbi:hypothetical protein MNV49_001540 [Pseudohyphozyma bogoriensis]|nr:hypothetical protein MNV49_001540 [Pseudohyphozyma bogoriensis]
MTLQFHCALPLPPESPYSFAPNTVGCFSTGKQIHEGRHEQIVEVWSAPGPIGGEENKDPEWRKKSALLVTATQIALSVNIGRMKTGIKAKPESKI